MDNKVILIGLGKMGKGLLTNFIKNGIEVIGYNRSKEEYLSIERNKNLYLASSFDDIFTKTDKNIPVLVWLMLSQGNAVDEVITNIKPYLKKGDTIVDGGNSYYKDSIRRAGELNSSGVNYLDIGVSGGINGATNGACMMIGGRKDIFDKYEHIFKSISLDNGYKYMGTSGCGHYTKMVHNAIEYGMMESIAEGLDLLRTGSKNSIGFEVSLKDALSVWNHGSIISSYLTELAEDIFTGSSIEDIDEIEPIIEENGEGAWSLNEAITNKVPFYSLSVALFERYSSKRVSFSRKVISLLRNKFGGHKTY